MNRDGPATSDRKGIVMPTISIFPTRRSDRLIVFALLVVALLVHLSGMLAAEFTGEDEMLFAVVARAFLSGLGGDANQLFRVFSFYYPPLQALLPAPLIGVFGLHPWTLRLPGALAGALTAPLLFLLMRRHGCRRRAALVAGVLAAIGSVAANHSYALTCGLFAGFGLIGAWGLAGFMASEEAPRENRSLLVGAIGITGAMMTLQDGFFYLPVLAAAYWSKRRWRVPTGAWPAFGIVGAWIAAYFLLWLIIPSLLADADGGAALKIRTGLSQIGALRLRELLLSFVAGSSWLAVGFALPLIPLGWMTLNRPLRWVVIFYAVPLAMWTVVFDYPNVRSAHMLLAFPAFALLWGVGAVSVSQRLAVNVSRLVPWWRGVLGVVLLSVAWQTVALHVPLPLADRVRRVMVLRGFYPQGRWIERFGQEPAGRWVRENTPDDLAVICNLGGSFGDYYANRPVQGWGELRRWVGDPTAAREAHVRFYVHFTAGPSPDDVDLTDLPVAAQGMRNGRVSVRIHDLWRESATTEVLK